MYRYLIIISDLPWGAGSRETTGTTLPSVANFSSLKGKVGQGISPLAIRSQDV
ncbi:MAG: hypothetical protein OZSIB_1846 [Candidatus Ozemobacter sibiricus]|uniref:Uncharacterized protein n=1 Tax=Candidatus Ozemobacter sibiricus TaxID=2268124 RepID=A0A367ZJ60_9BACT|nr:MAG: hypothetical protein OZSIB_1846 [Candidatus Ozemobacter sibiricus]